ncbi:hypothetical protein D2E90_17315 [Mycobacteroides abscessus]|nr:hypothetical protein D2E90_17315 [Mycobacteroides abscessus]
MALFIQCPRAAQELPCQLLLLAKLNVCFLQLPRDCLAMAFKLSGQFECGSSVVVQRHQFRSFNRAELAHFAMQRRFPYFYFGLFCNRRLC